MELDSASLADLSSQLRSLGYISRDLDLSLLFASTPTSTSHLTSASAILAHQQLLANEARAREQVVRCLWSMLGARSDASEGFEALAARERVGNYELERVKGMMGKEKRAREAAEREQEKEAAKAKTALTALAKEQERHRHAKEELIKARSALQMVKTQALHDQKRRETELSATMTRMQRLTSDPAQSKFVVLNPTSLSLTTSSARPSRSSVSSSRTPTPVSDNDATEAEVAFLQEALDECEAERRRFESENEGLRGLVGEVGEWTEGMLEMDGVKGSEQDEAAKAMEPCGDESYHIPTPHLTLSIPELSAPLYNKLYQIRVGVQALVDTTDSRIEAARAELTEQLEIERQEREEEEKRRTEAEKELEDAKERIASSDQLVKDFASQRFLAGIGGDADESGDEMVPPAKSLKVSPTVKKASTSASLAASTSENTRAAFESERATSVADFLADLGLDSPVVAPGAKTLSSAAPVASTSSSSAPRQSSSASTSNASRQSSSSSSAPRPSSSDAPRPSKSSSSRSKSTSHSSRPAKSSSQRLPPLAEEVPPSAPAAFDDHPPSPFLSSAPAPGPAAKKQEPKSRSALADIMAMADSPPLARTSVPSKSTSTSSSLLEKSKAKAREKEGTATKVSVTGSVRRTILKENSAPARVVERKGPMPSVF